MEVKITEVQHEISGNTIVAFVHEWGAAKAAWYGSIPKVGGWYFVEADVCCLVTWNIEIKSCPADDPRIWLDSETFYAQGMFCIYDIDFFGLRVGDSHFTFAQDVKGASKTEQPCVLSVSHRAVALSDMNL